MNIVCYSESSSDSSNDSNELPNKRRKLTKVDACDVKAPDRGGMITPTSASDTPTQAALPTAPTLPSVPCGILGMFKEQDDQHPDDSTLHGGRTRTYEHVRGNWSSYVYAPVPEDDAWSDLSDDLVDLLAPVAEFKAVDHYHISLSRTVVLKHHWIESFINGLRSDLNVLQQFPCSFSDVHLYCNDEKSRTFLSIQVDVGCDALQSAVVFVDKHLQEFNLPIYYKNPSFHVSVLWSLGDVRESVDSDLLEKLNSPDLTLNTYTPDFTACFQYTVLTWIPVFLFLVALPVHLMFLRRRSSNHTICQYSKLNAIKSTVSCALVVTSFLELIFAASYHGPDTSAALITASVLNLITLFLVLLVTRYEYTHGEHSSSLLFVFWLIKLPCDVFIFRSQFVREYGEDDSINSSYYATKDVSFALVCVQFILSLFSDRAAMSPSEDFTGSMGEKSPLLGGGSTKVSESAEQPKKKPMPELSSASWLKLTFWWQTPDIVRGYKKPVVFDDLYDLRPTDTCQKTLPTFNNVYFENEDTEETIYTLKANEFPKRSLLSATLLSVWGLMAGGSVFRVASIIMTLVNPQLLRIMIAYVDRDDPYTWKGIAICAILMVSIFANSIFTHTFMHTCMVAGLRARTIVNAVVYRKALKLSSEAKRQTTVGQIVNLMSVDAQKIQDAFQFWHLIWSVPLLVGFAMYFLWQTIGVSCLAGLAVLIILVPVNGLFLANRVRKLQMLQMKEKDSRLKIMNEVLAGMKVLKLYAWEPSFERDILECREKELQGIRKINYYNAVGAMTWLLTPYLISLAIFSTYTSLSPDNILDPDKAFVSLSLINMLAFPLAMLPQGVSICAQAFVSMKRIEKFMELGELQDDAVVQDRTMIENAIDIQDGTFSWGGTDKPTLKNINMTVKRGQLVAIVGLVGAGKSSLVGTLVGELLKTRGSVRVNGSMAYVPQQAWIQNATLKDNILFGKPYDQKKYEKCVEDCALTADLKNLPGGDMTEIGEKGINVSGGQKQRVSLARSVYQDEAIYILDDPLSAVDAHVGKHIFENVIGPKGCLQGKTRVLVTHGLTYLSQVDHIFVLHQGKIFEAGTYNDLIEKDGAFAHYIRTYLTEEDLSETESDAEEISELRAKMAPSGDSGSEKEVVKPVERRGSSYGRRSSATSGLIRRRPSRAMSVELDVRPLKKQQHKPAPKKLIEEEVAEVGSVKPRVLKAYISAGSWVMFWIMIVSHILVMCTQAFTNIWLTIWTDHLPVNGTYEDGELTFYLGIYGGTGGLQAIIALIEAMCVAHGCWRASMIFHNDLLTRILRAPMSFFDTTPLGRIMNRFSKDIDILDANMPLFIRAWLFVLGPAIMTIFLIAYSTPIFLAVVIPIIIVYIASQRFYIATVRQLKRIDNVRRSPIYTHFDESIVGATSIRAYNKSEYFVQKCDNLIDESQKPWYLLCVANRWCGVTMEFLGSLIVFFAALFAVLGRGESVSASTAGLSVTYALQITSFLTSLIRTASDLETYVVSVERVDEYINAPNEAPWEIPENKPPRNWPAHGQMSFKQYSTRYREGLDLVLKDIECNIKSGEKIGVVGRTGAGKSSLSLALFRIIEAAHGQISIDGETVEDMGLHDLRSKVGIIPQDPVIFSGTIRHNLDPFSLYSDQEIWNALELAHLKRYVTNNADQLDYQCGEGGEALSVGQRQLLCLARALLKKSKILVLDEATAAVDMETDALIQETIKQEFDNNTILTVAHRLNTVMDYDRIMVLDKGEVKQFDSPENLLKDTKGIFYGMAKDAKLV